MEVRQTKKEGSAKTTPTARDKFLNIPTGSLSKDHDQGLLRIVMGELMDICEEKDGRCRDAQGDKG